MQRTNQRIAHANDSSSLADLLERILDKGIVITGDIKIKLVEVELLTIQIRLMIASVDKAREMGMDWWTRNPDFTARPALPPRSSPLSSADEIAELKQRIAQLEGATSIDDTKIDSSPVSLDTRSTVFSTITK